MASAWKASLAQTTLMMGHETRQQMEAPSPDYELGCRREGNHRTLNRSEFHETGLRIDDIVRVYEGAQNMLLPDLGIILDT